MNLPLLSRSSRHPIERHTLLRFLFESFPADEKAFKKNHKLIMNNTNQQLIRNLNISKFNIPAYKAYSLNSFWLPNPPFDPRYQNHKV